MIELTLSQLTILDSFKVKEFADDNFKCDGNGRNFLRRVEKHCGKRRNCLLRAVSLFPCSVFKRLELRTHKNQGLFGKGLMG